MFHTVCQPSSFVSLIFFTLLPTSRERPFVLFLFLLARFPLVRIGGFSHLDTCGSLARQVAILFVVVVYWCVSGVGFCCWSPHLIVCWSWAVPWLYLVDGHIATTPIFGAMTSSLQVPPPHPFGCGLGLLAHLPVRSRCRSPSIILCC